jgi:hypothetical protein
LGYIKELQENFDIIQLTQIYSYMKIKRYKEDLSKIIVRKHEKHNYSTGSYIITKQGAKKILELIHKV